MRPVSPRVLDALRLKDVAERELSAPRNLIPPEPDLSIVPSYATIIATTTKAKLGGGMIVRPSTEISARKSQYGLRPIPFLGVHERVAYLALTLHSTMDFPALQRSPEDWLAFSQGPAAYGASLAPRRKGKGFGTTVFSGLMPWSSPITYVVKSDVVAFYRHIDHQILGDELIGQGANYESVSSLIELLGEVQQRPFGLPQLYEASDILSEIYVDTVERKMLRKKYAIWRFNDDFRIASKGYMNALKSIESLDQCLRESGLTLNEAKTTITEFSNYYLDVMGLELDPAGGIAPRVHVEDAVADYTEDFTQDIEQAASYIDRITDLKVDVAPNEPATQLKTESGKANLRIRDATPGEVRTVRRALVALARVGDRRAMSKIAMIVRYQAELMPAAINYLLMLRRSGAGARSPVARVIDELSFRTATNDWQKIWLAYAYGESGVLALKSGRRERLTWLRECQQGWSALPLQAAATLALAKAREADMEEVLSQMATAPESLNLYYAAALRAAGGPENRLDRAKVFAHDPVLKKLASS